MLLCDWWFSTRSGCWEADVRNGSHLTSSDMMLFQPHVSNIELEGMQGYFFSRGALAAATADYSTWSDSISGKLPLTSSDQRSLQKLHLPNHLFCRNSAHPCPKQSNGYMGLQRGLHQTWTTRLSCPASPGPARSACGSAVLSVALGQQSYPKSLADLVVPALSFVGSS